jgi:hypothetical protein
MFDLTGFIDPHVHTAPDLVPRLLDDVSSVREAFKVGMAGILIKSHTTLTADRAALAAKVVPGIRVWGGLVLNRSVGGFNPAAVEIALAYGAAEIWMPTLDAANHRDFHGQGGGRLTIQNLQASGSIHEILQLIAEHDAILGTGHLSVVEICALVRMAHQHGIKKILVTHPEAPFIDIPISVQRDLARLGCRFERTWVFTTPAFNRVLQPQRIIQDIREVGFESTVLATDMGQVGNPPPVEGFREFVKTCLDAGFAESEVRRMGAANIVEWLT